jgi:hypothetical protein
VDVRILLEPIFVVNPKIREVTERMVTQGVKCNGKDKGYHITGHEDPEGE